MSAISSWVNAEDGGVRWIARRQIERGEFALPRDDIIEKGFTCVDQVLTHGNTLHHLIISENDGQINLAPTRKNQPEHRRIEPGGGEREGIRAGNRRRKGPRPHEGRTAGSRGRDGQQQCSVWMIYGQEHIGVRIVGPHVKRDRRADGRSTVAYFYRGNRYNVHAGCDGFLQLIRAEGDVVRAGDIRGKGPRVDVQIVCVGDAVI